MKLYFWQNCGGFILRSEVRSGEVGGAVAKRVPPKRRSGVPAGAVRRWPAVRTPPRRNLTADIKLEFFAKLRALFSIRSPTYLTHAFARTKPK